MRKTNNTNFKSNMEDILKFHQMYKDNPDELTKRIYKITDEELSFHKIIKNNANTNEGYQAYYNLHKSIIDRDGDISILFDDAMNFEWDDKLNTEFNKLALADNRPDLI